MYINFNILKLFRESTREFVRKEGFNVLYLPSHSETKPTQKEDNMPPMEKMATDSDQREVRVPAGMGAPYRWIHVALYSPSILCRETRADPEAAET